MKKIGKKVSLISFICIVILGILFVIISALTENNAWIENYKILIEMITPLFCVLSGGVAVSGLVEKYKGNESESEGDMP